jgi:hypothetical protein
MYAKTSKPAPKPAAKPVKKAVVKPKPTPSPTATSQIKYAVDSYESGWKVGKFGKDTYSYNVKSGKIVKGVKGAPAWGGN